VLTHQESLQHRTAFKTKYTHEFARKNQTKGKFTTDIPFM